MDSHDGLPVDHRHAALVVASVATAGSLYLSVGMGLVPCDLCWYQRILMYPLVLILGVGILRGDAVRSYVLPFSVGGLAVAAYHIYLQRTPATTGACTGETPCEVILYEFYGFSIPEMSLTAFGIITVLLLLPIVLRNR